MTPGLALFYGGLNRSKGTLNMMMMSFSCIGLISVLWALYGFAIAFGTNSSTGVNKVLGSFTPVHGHRHQLAERDLWLQDRHPDVRRSWRSR